MQRRRYIKVALHFIFSASPNGVPPTEFVSTKHTVTSISFENADNDFPQRVVYAKSDDGLVATISDLEDKNKITFKMKACVR